MRIKKSAESEVEDMPELWMGQDATTDSEPVALEGAPVAPPENPDNDPDLTAGELPDTKGFPVRMHGHSDLQWARLSADSRLVMVSDAEGGPATTVEPLAFLQDYAKQDGSPLYSADLERMKAAPAPPSQDAAAVGPQESRVPRPKTIPGGPAAGIAAGLGAAVSMPFNWMAAGGRSASKEAQKCISQWRERSLLRSDQQVIDLQTQTEALMDRIKQHPEVAPFIEKVRVAQEAGNTTKAEKLQQAFHAQCGPQSGSKVGQDVQALFDSADQLQNAMKANLRKTAAAGGDVTDKFVSYNQTLRQLSQDPTAALIKNDKGLSLADKLKDIMKSILAFVKRLLGGRPQQQEAANGPSPR